MSNFKEGFVFALKLVGVLICIIGMIVFLFTIPSTLHTMYGVKGTVVGTIISIMIFCAIFGIAQVLDNK